MVNDNYVLWRDAWVNWRYNVADFRRMPTWFLIAANRFHLFILILIMCVWVFFCLSWYIFNALTAILMRPGCRENLKEVRHVRRSG